MNAPGECDHGSPPNPTSATAYVHNPHTWTDPLGLENNYAPGQNNKGTTPSSARERGASKEPLTNSQQRDLARWNGMSEVRGNRSHGQPVFRDGKKYVSYDKDGHRGGVWKVHTNKRNFEKGKRSGTFNYDLTQRVGD